MQIVWRILDTVGAAVKALNKDVRLALLVDIRMI